ncbi:MAG: HlyD family secretion protein [bacterium]|nr:HlyD family secretion protein [bacterium]
MTRIPENTDPKDSSNVSNAKYRRNNPVRTIILLVILIIIVAVGGPYGLKLYRLLTTTESTDNAAVQANIVSISSRISGTVASIDVIDYQRVSAGDILVSLDTSDLEITLEQAKASLNLAVCLAEVARIGIDQSAMQAESQSTTAYGGFSLSSTSIEVASAAVDAARASVDSAEARLAQAQAGLDLARTDYERFLSLAEDNVISEQELEHAETAFKVAQASVESAQSDVSLAQSRLQQAELNVEIAEAQQRQSEGAIQGAEAGAVGTDVKQKQYEAALAQVEVAQAAVDAVELQLSYTSIVAPSDGRLGRISAQVGQRISSNQPLMPLVSNDIWVIANFKETQINQIHPGLPVEIRVDTFPGKIFSGQVDSLSPASGATFALLPPENASGNFTKVVQRIPVRIVFDPESISGYEDLLEPGMSVFVRVEIISQNE